MIELIFVIVIIGTLAAVAIFKLAKNKDDAMAANCEYSLGLLIREIGVAYTGAADYTTWNTVTMGTITNTQLSATSKGISNADAVVNGNVWNYVCDGENMATLTPALNHAGDYQLTIAVNGAPTAPANKKAVADLRAQYGGTTKVFGF